MSSQTTTSCPSASSRETRSLRVTTIRIREFPPERGRVGAAAPLDPRAVLGGDEPGQRRPVVVRGHGSEAAAADRCDDGALRLDAAARVLVIGGRDEMRLALAHLEGECALACLGKHLLR